MPTFNYRLLVLKDVYLIYVWNLEDYVNFTGLNEPEECNNVRLSLKANNITLWSEM